MRFSHHFSSEKRRNSSFFLLLCPLSNRKTAPNSPQPKLYSNQSSRIVIPSHHQKTPSRCSFHKKLSSEQNHQLSSPLHDLTVIGKRSKLVQIGSHTALSNARRASALPISRCSSVITERPSLCAACHM